MLEDIYVPICLLAFRSGIIFIVIVQQLTTNMAHTLNVISAVSTVFLSVSTMILAVATIILAINSKAQIEESHAEFETNQRPWLNSNETVADGPLSFNRNGATLQLKVQITNSGNTPATNLFLNGIIIVDEPEQSFLPANRFNTLRRRCTVLRASRETNPQTQLSIFPKSHIEGGWGAYAQREDIEKAKNSLQGAIQMMPHVMFCIDYQFTYIQDRHLTAQLFSLTSDTSPPFSMNEGDPPITVKLTLEGTYAD
jgi:hypothetical protein